MRLLTPLAVATALVLLPFQPAGARDCSHDTFTVDGTAVTVTLCGAAAPKGTAVTETVSAPGGSVSKVVTVEGTGAPVVRSADDVSLERLGLKRTLHLTLAVRGIDVTLERALALPGALILK